MLILADKDLKIVINILKNVEKNINIGKKWKI